MTTAGSWEQTSDAARFVPRYPPAPGIELVVVGRSDDAWRELTRVRVSDSRAQSQTVVELIEPDVGSVPANLLRFAITFSSEMEDGSAAGSIHLLDHARVELPGTLLGMPPELWNRDHRRLTVLLEPGRIKRGLQPNVQAGPPLRDGDTITVAVDSEIRDASGSPLPAGAIRAYRVEGAIRSRIDPRLWEIAWPNEHDDSLVVRFDRPLDGALVRRCLSALDGDGRIVPGLATHEQDARTWTFTPAERADLQQLRVDTRLEDLAGNSVRRVFDRDLADADETLDADNVTLRRQP